MRKFNKQMYNYLQKHGEEHTLKEWHKIINKKFKEDFTLKETRKYFVRHDIKFKYEMPRKANGGLKLAFPIGAERTKPDGMVQVKIAPKKWEYKQRLIYEQYYGVKLRQDEFVIFLDQNKNNFAIDNLKVISRQESAYMVNQKLFSKDKNATETGILITKLVNKTKEVTNEKS